MELTARGLEEALSNLCGQPLSADEGVKFGNTNAPINDIINCWSFNAEVAELARTEKCNLILSQNRFFVINSKVSPLQNLFTQIFPAEMTH